MATHLLPKVGSHVGIRKGYPPSLTCLDVPVAVIFLPNLLPADNIILPLIIFIINFPLRSENYSSEAKRKI
jgi:hypothetical protein